MAKETKLFSSFGVINANVPHGNIPLCTDLVGENPAKLYEIAQIR